MAYGRRLSDMLRHAHIGPVAVYYDAESAQVHAPVSVRCETQENVLATAAGGCVQMSLALSPTQARHLLECLAFIFDYKLTKG